MPFRSLLAACAAAAVLGPAPAAHAATTCAPPTGPEEFQRVAPAQVDLDGARLRSATRFMTSRLALSVRIYRHGCLAATSDLDRYTQHTRNNLWSATKGVVALLAGRAITQGALGLDDPIGRYLPEADTAHGAITVRQLLTQTSGLRFSWLSDLLAKDTVRYTLSLPFAHEPGTWFEYAQTTVTLLAAVIQRAVGDDLQAYAQRELFDPLGIPRSHWSWSRDARRQTHGYAFLSLPPKDLGRIGQLLLQEGRWRGEQLIDPGYVRELRAPTPTNPGYGFLIWTNAGERFLTASAPARREVGRRFIPAAPPDAYAITGFMGQYVIVLPSLDMVIVRTGLPSDDDPTAGDIDQEGTRRLMQAVADVDVPDPGPLARTPGGAPFDLATWLDPRTLRLALR